MPLGECVKQDFLIFAESPTIPQPYVIPTITTAVDCCFYLEVLAETVITDAIKNDKSSFIRFYNNTFSGSSMILQKKVNCEWSNVATLNNNTYGTYYAFGWYTNELAEKAMGYQLDWQKVLTGLGEGVYRIQTIDVNVLAGNQNQYSFEYNLREWTADREDTTVKISWNINGFIGHPTNDQRQRHFGTLNWYSEIRLLGNFGRESAETESEYVHYQSGTLGKGKEVWTKNKFFLVFLLELYPVPSYVHRYLLYDLMLGDNIRISDFNQRNPVNNIERYVKVVGGFEPRWNFGVKDASLELKFEQLYQNNIHKRS